jgi:hypothetical protein
MTLQEAREKADNLLEKIEKTDPDDASRIAAYLDLFWNDQVSIEESIQFMKECF